ncbi:acyltransferase family protein [Actinomadura viridis]|uniref:Fucose 4-O-acetylase-like acetyltransferase n=1 Tax=Actinomadura viridis TaxID=58110 RepID=A0A931GHB2_9ACTN|nr:acyltransferase family protein [Actinomadura viridis]MBG6086672.1 fucose 4-O-acetylase-like acetyltransferase [Actinomadura viridis]
MTYRTPPSVVPEPGAEPDPAPGSGSAPDTAVRIPAPAPAPDGSAPAAPAAAPSGTPPAPRRRERDPFFDNAKFLAILLVVIGHSLAYRLNVPMAKGLYMFIYMFHMPMFIVVTGYFSRNWTFAGGKARKLITNVGVPYVVFEIAYSLYDWLVGRNELEVSLLDPYFLTWFLCALFFWRLSTPVWQQIRWPLAVALIFSLLSYMSDLGNTFNIHRVIGLLPFYVLGLLLKPEHFELLKRPAARVLGALTLMGGLGVAYLTMDRMNRSWIYWKDPHQELGVDNITGTLMRLGMFACATVLVAAFLAVVPGRKTWFTKLGTTTLYAYLLHGFVTRLLQFTDWWDAEWLNTVPGLITVIIGAALVGTFLCSKPVVLCMSWALEPKMKYAFTPLRRPGSKSAAGPGKDGARQPGSRRAGGSRRGGSRRAGTEPAEGSQAAGVPAAEKADGADGAAKTGSSGSSGSTESTGHTESTGNTGSAGTTASTENTENAAPAPAGRSQGT